MFTHLHRHPAARALLLAAVLLVPFFAASGYQLLKLSSLAIYALALLGIVLLTGFVGQISLGQGAFFALGGYSAAVLIASFGMPYWASIVPAAALCFVFGYLFGIPAIRLSTHHLALATFGLAMAVPPLIRYKLFAPWTGGVQGIVLDKPKAPFGLPLSSDQWLYALTLCVVLLCFTGVACLVRGRLGRAMRAARDNPVAAAAMGVDVARIKCIAFGLSALLTGVAGACSAVVTQFVSPDSYDVYLSLYLLVGAIVGGLYTPWGAVLGAIVIEFLPTLAEHISKTGTSAVYGVMLIIVVYLAPSGITGTLGKLAGKLRDRMVRRAAQDAPRDVSDTARRVSEPHGPAVVSSVK
jgi:branched-chain amino acid transport system permease protein